MADMQRPTRVVVVDADNPMSEIRGEFFWREDHEQLLKAAGELAYREGYDQGFAAGSLRADRGRQIVRTKERRHVIARTLASVVAIAFLVNLIANFLR